MFDFLFLSRSFNSDAYKTNQTTFIDLKRKAWRKTIAKQTPDHDHDEGHNPLERNELIWNGMKVSWPPGPLEGGVALGRGEQERGWAPQLKCNVVAPSALLSCSAAQLFALMCTLNMQTVHVRCVVMCPVRHVQVLRVVRRECGDPSQDQKLSVVRRWEL